MIIYRSTDSGAPIITNANGSFIAALTAILVNGYGSKAGAGWTRPFTGTNLAVYRQGAGGNGRYLRVFDATVNNGLRRAHLRGYEAMTAISTGTNPFPTLTQINGNGQIMPYWQSNDGTGAQRWIAFASSRFFYFFIVMNTATPAPVPEYYELCAFGSFLKRKLGDTYNDILIAGTNEADNIGQYLTRDTTGQQFVARSDTNAIGARDAVMQSPFRSDSAYVGLGNPTEYPYPDRVVSGLSMANEEIWVAKYHRGWLPGLWSSPHGHAALGPQGTTFSGQGTLAGKTFELIGPVSTYAGQAMTIMETSDTWTE